MPPASRCNSKGCVKEEFKDGFCLAHFNQRQDAGKKGRKGKKPKVKVEKNKAAIVDLISSLKRQPKFAKMVDYSCECLQKLCVDEVSREELVDSGVVEALFHVLSLNQGNEEKHQQIQDAINKTLKAMSVSVDLSAETASRMKDEDWAMMTNSLSKHTSSKTLQSSAEALLALTRSEDALDSLLRAGGARAASKVLKKGVRADGSSEVDLDDYKSNKDLDDADSAGLSPEAMAANASLLARMAGRGLDHAAEILESGCLPSLIAAARRFPNHEGLAQAATELVAALAPLAALPGAEGERYARMLREAGALDLLMDSLERFPFNDAILDAAREALRYLTGDSDMKVALDYFKNVGPDGEGVPLDERTAKHLGRVAALLLAEQNVEYLKKAGGTAWVQGLMRRALANKKDPNCRRILANGARILQRFCVDEENIKQCVKQGEIELLQAILADSLLRGDEEVASAVLNALAALAVSKKQAKAIAKNDELLGDILKVLKHAPLGKAHSKAAIALIQAMGAHRSVGKQLVEAGTLPVLMELLKSNPPPEVARHLINAIMRLATSEKSLREIVRQGFVDAVLNLVAEHPDHRDLIREALMALETATLVSGAVDALQRRAAENRDLLETAMANHPNDAQIQEFGARLLDTIENGGEAALRAEMEAAAARRIAEETAQAEELLRLKIEEDQRKKAAQEREEALKRREAELAELRRQESERAAQEHAARMAQLEKLRIEEERMLQEEEARRLKELEALREKEKKRLAEEEARRAEEERRLEAERAQRRLADAQRQAHEQEIEKMRLERLAQEKIQLEHAERMRQEQIMQQRAMELQAAQQAEIERLRRVEEQRLRLEAEAQRQELERLELEQQQLDRAEQLRREREQKKLEMAEKRRAMQLDLQAQEQAMRDRAVLKRQMKLEEASADQARKLDLARKAREEEEMAEALRVMKREEAAELRRQEREARMRQLEEKRKKQAELEKARMLGTVQKQKKFASVQLTQSAREVFDAQSGAERAKKKAELPGWAKDFLLAGALLTKHSNNAAPRQRHVYLSADLEYLCWKNPKKQLEEKQRMKIFDMQAVEAGRATPQLQRKKGGKYLAQDEDCCFAIHGVSGSKSQNHRNRGEENKKERSLDLEARSAEEAERWVEAIELLIEYARELHLWGSSTVVMTENVLLRDSALSAADFESDEE